MITLRNCKIMARNKPRLKNYNIIAGPPNRTQRLQYYGARQTALKTYNIMVLNKQTNKNALKNYSTMVRHKSRSKTSLLIH